MSGSLTRRTGPSWSSVSGPTRNTFSPEIPLCLLFSTDLCTVFTVKSDNPRTRRERHAEKPKLIKLPRGLGSRNGPEKGGGQSYEDGLTFPLGSLGERSSSGRGRVDVRSSPVIFGWGLTYMFLL